MNKLRLLPAILCGAFALGLHAENLTMEVPFELGVTNFAPGDNITIQHVYGTSKIIAVGGTYAVEGTYTLASKDEAELSLFVTTHVRKSTDILPAQTMHIEKGSGKFHLVETMNDDGYFHVSFYSGGSFGGVYFGQGDGVLKKSFGHRVDRLSGISGSVQPGNEALIRFLGDPVPMPHDMDARYTKEGLTDSLLSAARAAHVTLKKLVIDDSEFPALIGVVCQGADAVKFKSQIKKLDGYQYGGGVGNDSNSDGSDTCNVINVTPHTAFPRALVQQIDHRLLLREQVFFARLSSAE